MRNELNVNFQQYEEYIIANFYVLFKCIGESEICLFESGSLISMWSGEDHLSGFLQFPFTTSCIQCEKNQSPRCEVGGALGH